MPNMSGQSANQWTASAAFARHVLSVELDRLPSEARGAVRHFSLDTIGVGIGGAGVTYAQPVLAAVRGWGDSQAASIWGSDVRLPAPSAAFMNAFMAHAQEFDCVHEGAVLHPFTVVVPVLLAEAERTGLSGTDYVAACAAGVDVAAGLGKAATSQIKFFRPATCGLFGAIAALGRARRVSHDTLVNAFGYGLAFASGTMQAHVEGTPALAAAVGNAARSAFQAMDLAQAGLPGPKGAIDGPFGYLSLFETSSALEPVLQSLGSVWRAADVSWKPYPTGRACHGGIEMMLGLRTKGLSADDVVSASYMVTPLIQHLVGRPYTGVPDVNYARLCLPYCAARALLTGGVGLQDFQPNALQDRETGAVAIRIAVESSANPDSAAFVPQSLRVVLRNGTEISARIEELPGTPRRPLTRDQQLAKFRACVAFGAGEGHSAAADRLIGEIDRLEQLPDVAVLSRLAAKGGRP
jgi:2-methylcitrate dehydratase PrpD